MSGSFFEELRRGLAEVGIEKGDTVFVHACLDHLDPAWHAQQCEDVYAALRDTVGSEGTLVVPTYTFSFCRHEDFDVDRTPTEGGPWSTSADFLEFFRLQPGAVRSCDPIHSVAALGPRAANLVNEVANTCFGEDSVHQRLLRLGGKILLLGPGWEEATFQHHVEEMRGVPFRYKKLFTGWITESGVRRKAGWIFNVHILAPNGEPEGRRLDCVMRAEGVCRSARVGKGEIAAARATDLYALLERELARDPWFTAAGPACDPVVAEAERTGARRCQVLLPHSASMREMIETLWRLPRDIVSDGYDAALGALSTQVSMTIHQFPTGTECFNWIIPEKWTCHEAWLETLAGSRIFAYSDHPLHVLSFSLPFEGEVTRAELLAHLHVHPRLADAIPFVFKYYERDWGLCCTQRQKAALTEERYRVVIRTGFRYGTLNVGEVVAPGSTGESMVLCAHLCHPGMVNDDLTGVAVGLDVMRVLLRRGGLRYTWRFLIVPETIGSVAWLSRHQALIPFLKGGIFVEMVGRDYPFALQLSLSGNAEIDQCAELAMKEHDPLAWTGAYRTVIGNDERQFNGPGVRVPMVSLSRILPSGAREWPYREYHTSLDTPDLVSPKSLEESRDMLLAIIDTIEGNITPQNRFYGEAFCSRYGLHIDFFENLEAHQALFRVMDLIDGTRTLAEIARAADVSFAAVTDIARRLRNCGLVA
jgi:aminopeptidase-like protein/aminoglycoside N3'-acetyltransferase